MTKIQTGEVLISDSGRSYRVVECTPESVSLIRVNGYTLFCCHRRNIELFFRPANKVAVA